MTPLYRYAQDDGADLLLAQLWARIHEDGDLVRLFEPGGCSMSTFFEALAPPTRVWYAFDSKGIWLLNWFEPFRHTALFSGYVRPDKRRSELSKAAVRDVLLRGCAEFGEPLIGITRHEHVVRFCEQVGFAPAGRIPALIAGYDAYIIYCTAQAVEASKLYGLADAVHAGA